MLLVEKWHAAIESRHSTRTYNGQPMPGHILEQMEQVCRDFRPSDSVRAKLVVKPDTRVFKGILGGYGKVKDAPAYVAFIGNLKAANVQKMIGYLGEGIILEATALGLATCWVGGFFRRQVVEDEIALAGDEHIFAVTPLGYPAAKDTFNDKLMRGFRKHKPRKSLDDLVSGLEPGDWPEWMKAGLMAARLAPSAMNRQPWRFHVEPQSVTLSLDNRRDILPVSKHLDCGIAMLHFELGALSTGGAFERQLLTSPKVAKFSVQV
jgi:nitroreductase